MTSGSAGRSRTASTGHGADAAHALDDDKLGTGGKARALEAGGFLGKDSLDVEVVLHGGQPARSRRILCSRARVSHWADIKVIASLAAAVALLGTFPVIESRSRHALMPLRFFRNRSRSGAFLVMLCLGTAMLGMFFFRTIFMQDVWGYSALKTGVAYPPMVTTIMAMAGVSTQLVTRIGARPRPLLLAASAISSGGMFWLSRIGEHRIMLLALIVTTVMIRITRQDLASLQTMAAG